MGESLYEYHKYLPSHEDIRTQVERYFMLSDEYEKNPKNEEGKPVRTLAIMDAIADVANVAAMSKIMAGLTKDGAPDDPLSAYLELSVEKYDMDFAREAVEEVMGREDTREFILSKQPYVDPIPSETLERFALKFIEEEELAGFEPLTVSRKSNFPGDEERYLVTGRYFGEENEVFVWDWGEEDQDYFPIAQCADEDELGVEMSYLFRDIAGDPSNPLTYRQATEADISNKYHSLAATCGIEIDGIERTGHFDNLERYFEEHHMILDDRSSIRRFLSHASATCATVRDGKLCYKTIYGGEHSISPESREHSIWPESQSLGLWGVLPPMGDDDENYAERPGEAKEEAKEMAKEWNCAKPVPDEVCESVCEYFLNAGGLGNYEPMTVIRKSNHPDDDYLYMVIGKKTGGKTGEDDNYAAWTGWNQSMKTLDHGHYGLKDLSRAYEIIDEFHTSKGLTYAERDVSQEFASIREEGRKQDEAAAEPRPARRKGR